MEEKHNYKLTDEQFKELLWECNGFLGLMPQKIREKHNINYSRQAVYDRAENFKDELKLIRKTLVDYAENKLFKLLNGDDAKLSARMVQYILDRLGKDRGYGKNGVDKILNTPIEQVYKYGDNIIRF